MKKQCKRLLSLVTALVMVFSLTACGGKKDDGDTTHFNFGKYELDYKGACIMPNEVGADALVMTFAFTNNSDESASYGWTVYEKVTQDGAELETAFVLTDPDTFDSVTDDYFTSVEPGQTLEVSTAYTLNGMGKVSMNISDLFDNYSYTITVDPSTLGRGDVPGADLPNEDGTAPEDSNKPAFLNWWDGDWYGWWIITSGHGDYEGYDGYFWDICVNIDAREDLTGTMTLWDTEDSRSNPSSQVEVSFNEAGVGEHGTMFAEGGAFYDDVLGHADWIVDPGLEKIDDLLWIDGSYEGSDGSYNYEIYLRPWGTSWDDITEEAIDYSDPLPDTYDWYMSFVNAGLPMPDDFNATADSVDVPPATEADPVVDDTSGGNDNSAAVETPDTPMSATMITPLGNQEATMDIRLPGGTWCLDDRWLNLGLAKIYNSASYNDVPFRSIFVEVKVYDSEERLNFYYDQYANVTPCDGYTIAGVEMQGRTFDHIGIDDVVEYYGQLPNGLWLGIQIYYTGPDYDNESHISTLYAILDTITFR